MKVSVYYQMLKARFLCDVGGWCNDLSNLFYRKLLLVITNWSRVVDPLAEGSKFEHAKSFLDILNSPNHKVFYEILNYYSIKY